MAVLGLRFFARAFSSFGKRGPLFIAVCGPLTIAASVVAEHRLQMRRLSNCGSRAQLLRGTWDLPRPGLEPVSPALAGRLSTTVPPGKPNWFVWWFLQQTFSDELPYTKHGAKCQGTDKDENVAFIFKEARILSSLGFEVRSRGCSRSLLRHIGVFPGVVRNQTTYSDFGTMPFD